MGCLAAYLLAEKTPAIINALAGRKRFFGILLGGSLVVVPSLNLHWLGLFLAMMGNLLQAIGFAILLVTSIVHPGSFKPLNWPLVVQLGVVSYSIYIWQQIFYAGPQTYGFSTVWWMSFPWWLFAALTAGVVSYYGFERPLLRLRKHFREV